MSPLDHEGARDAVADDHSADASGGEAEAAAPRVVHIGLPAVGLLALSVAAVSLGYWLGRGLNPGAPVPASASNEASIDVDASVETLGDVPGFGEPAHPLLFQAAPDFMLTRLDTGEADSLAAHKGKTVMVNFWATWCLPCRMEMPWLQAAHDSYAEDGLVILAVNAGEKVPEEMALPTIQSFVQSMGLTFPVLVGDLSTLYDVQSRWSVWGLPASFIVDGNGIVVDAHTGMYPSQGVMNDKIEGVLNQSEG
jgi:thiol-disulfide isomerase/thioredoxin